VRGHLLERALHARQRERGVGVQRRGQHRGLAVALPVDQAHLVAVREGSGEGVVLDAPGRQAGGQRAVAQVVDRPLAAVLAGDPLHEGRDHLLQFGEHGGPHPLRFVEFVGAEAQQQRLKGLPGAVDPEVASGCRGQQAAHGVERLGADGPLVGGRLVVRRPGMESLEVRLRAADEPGVGLERVVEHFAIAPPVGGVADLGRGDVLPAAVRALGVGHVAGRLFQVRHQAAALEDLGQDVGDALAGDVGAAELGDRVVAVLAEHAGVERGGAAGRAVGVAVRGRLRQVRVELVEV